MARRLHVNLAVIERRRAEAAALKGNMAENLAGLFARFDDVERAGRAG